MNRLVLSATVVILAACGTNEATLGGAEEVTTATGTRLSFEDFKARFARWDADRQVFIADGDTIFVNEKQLREFYELNVREGQLIVNRVGNTDDIWDTSRRQNLSYCVSNDFGARKATVVSSMQAAAQSWMAVANVRFLYVAAQDGACTRSNANVLFNVRPIDAGGSYLASAFFPSNGRSARELVIDASLFAGVSVTGVLRHELGHVLGFRHEHTRPEAGTCFEDNSWRAVTAYDSNSVMHYPQCNGTNSWNQLPLTQLDIQGVQALYGTPTTTPTPVPPSNPATTIRNFQDSVGANANKTYGPFAVQPGTAFRATMTGSGDADLYVRFGTSPTASSYDCRPYLGDSSEECRLTSPTTPASAYITIVGYSAATYALQLEFISGGVSGTPTPAPSTGTPTVSTVTSTIAKGTQQAWPGISVVPGTRFVVTMTGNGDPDLYVKFGAAPTVTAFDCRPYANGANEVCTLTVPAGQTQAFVMVQGFAAGTFSLNIEYSRP